MVDVVLSFAQSGFMMFGPRARSVLAALLVSGCAGLSTYQPKSVDEAIRLSKEANGTGCVYFRGNGRPYADAATMYIGTWGKGTKFTDCLEHLPAEARAIFRSD